MKRHRFVIMLIVLAAFLSWGAGPAMAQMPSHDSAAVINKMLHRTTAAQREAAAARIAEKNANAVGRNSQANGLASPQAMNMPMPGTAPDYFGMANWTNSPLPVVDQVSGAISGGIRKFIDKLPGLDTLNNLNQKIPVAVADKLTYPGSDYYEIGLVQYREKMHTDLPPTLLRGYVQLNDPANPATHDPVTGVITAWPQPQYLGPLIIAQKNRPVRIKFTNLLPTGHDGDLFIPVDTTAMGAGMGPYEMNPPVGGMDYTQNRGVLHLHGGHTPWISDGTPHQWITPAGEVTSYPKGVSVKNVPDMPDPGDGSMTFFYTNQQSARLMFYHDHSYGITRLNVYAGEVAGYIVQDPTEQALVASNVIPSEQIPLIIQDKTFVDPARIAATDPTWNSGSMPGMAMAGDLWFPHVYMPNQNPADDSGANPFGRWDYGPWFWPPLTTDAGLVHGEVANPYYDPINAPWEPPTVPGTPNVSMVMEAYMDTPLVNGTAYPFLQVGRKAYRFRILNGCNDRFLNLQLYYAKSNTIDSVDGVTGLPTLQTLSGEVPMVPAVATAGFPATWPTDGRDGGVPDPAAAGPSLIQIGTEGGVLPAPAVIPSQPVNYNYNRRDIVVLNVAQHALFLGPAERADVIIDFSQVPDGSKLILYNDSPAPVPAFDPRVDYYTGDPDQTSTGGAPTTLPGYGPNTRTIMQFQVSGAAAPAFDLATLNTELPKAFVASQPPIIVPEKAYGAATNKYVRIQDTSITFTPNGSTTPLTLALQPKAIQELFELNYGRMNSTLGVELPLTNFLTQTTIPLGYIDPATEILDDSVTQMSPVAGDGTQIWKITHNGVDTHAIHFHLYDVQLVNRVGWDGAIRPPDANELGWKDTVRMNPLEDAIVALRPTAPALPFGIPDSIRLLDPTMPEHSTTGFTNIDPLTNTPITVTNEYTNFGWEYVWHCHLLGHEEMDMMRPVVFNVARSLPQAPVLSLTMSGAVTTLHWTDGTPVSYTDTTTWGNPANETGYRIERALGSNNPFQPLLIAVANSTSYADTTAVAGVGYRYRVTAFNAAGESVSNTAIVIFPPGAPTAVTATRGNAQATVSFTAPVSDGGSPITLYTVTSSPGGKTATGTASPITVTGLTNGTAYTFTVTATNAAGTSPASAASSSVTPATTPGAPTAATAVAGNLQATVSFTAPVSNGGSAITSYTVTSSTGGKTATGAASPITVTGLTAGTAYTFTVTATNSVGTGPASAPSNSVTPVTLPGAPTAVTATRGNAQATITFTAPVNGRPITSYTVTSSTGGKTATGTASPITVTGLTNGTAYTFTVTATNSVGTGPASAASNSVTPATVPGAPTAATATRGNAQASVSFTAPASNGGSAITSYTVTSSPGGRTATGTAGPLTVTGLTNGTAYTFTVTATNAVGTGPASAASNSVTPATLPGAPTVTTVTGGNTQAIVSFTAGANGGSPITSYTVTSSPGGRTATGTAGPLTVTGLTNGTAYTFTVNATNAIGTGPASAPSSSVTPATLPGAPTAVSAVPGDTRAVVSFTAPASNGGSPITSYTVTSSPGGRTATATAGPITVTGLTNGTAYTFTVKATNSVGTGPASGASAAVTPVAPLPAAPSNLVVTTNSGGGFAAPYVVLGWTDNANNEQGFYVERSSNAGATWTRIGQTAANVVAYTDNTVARVTAYRYRVQAFGASGVSAFSNILAVTTK